MEPQRDVVGVIVARFQDYEIHPGQRDFVQQVAARHKQLLFVLGSTGGAPDARNPLPYTIRRAMIREVFPDLDTTIVELKDHPLNNEFWSKELDSLIENTLGHTHVQLYGSRDSFLTSYKGVFPSTELPCSGTYSATARRESIEPSANAEFRKGMIYAITHLFPHTYPTVDIGIVDRGNRRVILGGRIREAGLYRFPGGFAELSTDTYEEDALRELSEEVPGIVCSAPQYVGSHRINDRRYEGSRDGIKTLFFVADYISGEPRAGDDLDFAEWFSFDEIMDKLVPTHRPLGEMLLEHLSKK